MKRGRESMAFNAKKNVAEPVEFAHILINYSGPSFSYLPRDIMLDVLLRLKVKSILACKFACKTWYDLVSDPGFAKRHFDQAQAYPLIQTSGDRVQSRMVYLVQPEEEDLELKLEMCDHIEYKSKCDCRVKFELDTKFKLPLHNLQTIFDGNGYNIQDHASRKGSNNYITLKMKDHKYYVVNSCNGLLCLSRTLDSDPVIICNPITSEFINLPEARKGLSEAITGCGFGFSPETNKYIAIRMYKPWPLGAERYNHYITAQVHTLGSETWKDIGFPAHAICGSSPTYLNGFLYWPYLTDTYCAISYDIENESFGFVSKPPVDVVQHSEVKVGALGGELGISWCFTTGFGVWILKEYGPTKKWAKVFSTRPGWDTRWSFRFGSCEPIKLLSDGALLMFHSYTNSLIYIHLRTQRFRYFKISGTSVELEVIAHIPSFVSLKDALSEHDVKVLKSRGAELKLRHEGVSFAVLEKNLQGLRRRFL